MIFVCIVGTVRLLVSESRLLIAPVVCSRTECLSDCVRYPKIPEDTPSAIQLAAPDHPTWCINDIIAVNIVHSIFLIKMKVSDTRIICLVNLFADCQCQSGAIHTTTQRRLLCGSIKAMRRYHVYSNSSKLKAESASLTSSHTCNTIKADA